MQEPRADSGRARIRLADTQQQPGGVWVARVPDIPPHSEAELLEDGTPLERHARVEDVSAAPARFAIEKGWIHFSPSSRSDVSASRDYVLSYLLPNLADLRSRSNRRDAPIPPALLIEAGQMSPIGGYGYAFELPDVLRGWSSQAELNSSSRLVVLEDGIPLPRPNQTGKAIRDRGDGRYVHWRDRVLFASSDGTDPRSNGRQYAIGLRPPDDHHYVDWRAGKPPSVADVLPAPQFAHPAPGARLATANPTFEVADPDPSLLYYFEIDTQSDFASPMLHRSPGVQQITGGVNPVVLIDRDPDLGPVFTLPYRVGAMSPLSRAPGNRMAIRELALRLGYGLETGSSEVAEVFEYVRNQYYPADAPGSFAPYEITLRRDRGYCKAINHLGSKLLGELGYATRRVALRVPRFAPVHEYGFGRHSSAEVYFAGEWGIFDPYLQFFLPGMSYQGLAEDASLPDRKARRMSRTSSKAPDLAERLSDFTDEDLWITLRDYAQFRRYDRFEDLTPWAAEGGDAERRLFAGEPHHISDPPFADLWSQPVLTLYARVRGLRLDRQQLVSMATNAPRGKKPPEPIEATPWTTIRFEVDLATAYRAHREVALAAP